MCNEGESLVRRQTRSGQERQRRTKKFPGLGTWRRFV